MRALLPKQICSIHIDKLRARQPGDQPIRTAPQLDLRPGGTGTLLAARPAQAGIEVRFSTELHGRRGGYWPAFWTLGDAARRWARRTAEHRDWDILIDQRSASSLAAALRRQPVRRANETTASSAREVRAPTSDRLHTYASSTTAGLAGAASLYLDGARTPGRANQMDSTTWKTPPSRRVSLPTCRWASLPVRVLRRPTPRRSPACDARRLRAGTVGLRAWHHPPTTPPPPPPRAACATPTPDHAIRTMRFGVIKERRRGRPERGASQRRLAAVQQRRLRHRRATGLRGAGVSGAAVASAVSSSSGSTADQRADRQLRC